ncbi:GGDEF domain-containing protein [Serratia sp. DD3]|uniref:GGDEF domain-containing protein n=1 Tax=Serratia sp. DD3 TaxID=1410619 RepID=UPI0004D4FCFD|nr:diguanylate cyclase [Serratia sp. DD3]KEY57335.1 diguanylate cyclase DosC [Serratia sp. DD3]
MKVKYLIYLFTFAIMLSFSLFVFNALRIANTHYVQNESNLYKLQRTKDISEAFQAVLSAHRLKRLSQINQTITEAQWRDADEQAHDKIAIMKSHAEHKNQNFQSVNQKFTLLSMISLLEKLLDNDVQQILQSNNPATAHLFNINSAYYIVQANKAFYQYSYDPQMINAESLLFIESISFNNLLTLSLTELIDQIIDVNLSSLERKDAYLKAIQLTGVIKSLNTRLTFIEQTYNDPKISSLVDSIKKHISSDQLNYISQGLYQAIDLNSSYNADSIYQYINEINQLSQPLYQRSFELQIAATQNKLYHSQTTIYGLIALTGLIILFVLLPLLIFCSRITRWLTKTHNNILRLSKGDTSIDNNEVFYSQELVAINDAVTQLKQYNQVKLALEQEKHQLIKDLELSSFFDPLTNIYNRRKFFIEYNLLPANSYPHTFCLIDIDKFKRLNDTYGHDIGDRVLVMFAELLRNHFRASDIFCRYGGEEFAVLLNRCSQEEASRLMNQLRELAEQLCLELPTGKRVRFTISCGIASVNNIEGLASAIKQADEALYYCKKSGRNRVSIYTSQGFIP